MRNRVSAAIAGWGMVLLFLIGCAIRSIIANPAILYNASTPLPNSDIFYGIGNMVLLPVMMILLLAFALAAVFAFGTFVIHVIPAFIRWTFTGEWHIFE